MRTRQLRSLALWSALALGCTLSAGCSGGDAPALLIDEDGDGFSREADCDDQDASVSPRAAETCDRVDDDCDGIIDDHPIDGQIFYADGDGDGYGTVTYMQRACEQEAGWSDTAGDCDDADAWVSPDGEERCDGVDDDCDGTVDEPEATDAALWFLDEDDDGYGNPYIAAVGCEAPAGYVASDTDCDDADPLRSPAALELCDDADVDEDCDLLVNDADTPYDPGFWFWDGDGDGHGDPAGATTACEAPLGYVGADDDCDDGDPDAHPGAAERCGDGVDQDCDGLMDEEGALLDWYGDGDGDGHGDAARPLGSSCAAVEGSASNADDCDDADPGVHPGAEETWYDGVDQDCDGGSDDDADGDGVAVGADCDDADSTIAPDLPELCGNGADDDCDGVLDPCASLEAVSTRSTGDHAGASLALIGDLNGDDQPELAVGAPRDDHALDDAGRVAVLRAGDTGSDVLSHALWLLDGESPGDRAGAALAGVDLDGDGRQDLVVGAPGSAAGLDGAGSVYLVMDIAYGTSELGDVADRWTGERAGDGAGAALAAAGDLDGDGLDDLWVGAPDAEGGSGAVFLAAGPLSGALDLSWATTRLAGGDAGDAAGSALAGGFDLDGDGVPDALVGGPLASEAGVHAGAAWLLLDPPAGSQSLDDADARWDGPPTDGRAGATVAAPGDLDGDGLEDLAVAAPEADVGGAVWLLAGGIAPSGALDDGLAWGTLRSTRAGAGLGSALSTMGDLDGDDLGDLAVGAPGEDTAGSDAGAVWLLTGSLQGDHLVESDAWARLDGPGEGQRAGAALRSAGDWDGDGWPDLAVGAPASDARLDLGGAIGIWGLVGE